MDEAQTILALLKGEVESPRAYTTGISCHMMLAGIPVELFLSWDSGANKWVVTRYRARTMVIMKKTTSLDEAVQVLLNP